MNAFDLCTGLLLSTVITFGIVGNIVSFLVWTKGRRCKKLPGGVYLRALAVSDTVALCIPATNEAAGLLFNTKPQHKNVLFCKLESIGRHFGLLVSSWIIVCFTIERTVAIFRPNTASTWAGKKRVAFAIVPIFMVNFFLNLPYGIVHTIIQTAVKQRSMTWSYSSTDLNFTEKYGNVSWKVVGYKWECGCDPSSLFSFLNWYHIWLMDFVLIFIIPFTIITFCNTLVMILIILRRSTLHTRQGSRSRSVTVRAVVVSVVHCITTGPFAISTLFPGHLERALTVKYSLEYYTNELFLTLAFLNHSVNFVLYSFFGSDFRRDCAEIMRKKSKVVHPETTHNMEENKTRSDLSATREMQKHGDVENTKWIANVKPAGSG